MRGEGKGMIDLTAYAQAKTEYEQAERGYKEALERSKVELLQLYRIRSLADEADLQREMVEDKARRMRQEQGIKTIEASGGSIVVADLVRLKLDQPRVIKHIRQHHSAAAPALIKEAVRLAPFRKWLDGQRAVGEHIPGVEEDHSWSVRITLDQE